MKKQKGHLIKTVKPDSIAEEMGIEPGDRLLEINGETVEDIFDYQYMIEEEYVEVLIAKPSGEEWLLEIDKDYAEDLGVEFENGLMDDYRSCSNKCIFCFIDQMPKGMRETLYFLSDHKSGAALHDAAQPFCRRRAQKGRSLLRGGHRDERSDRFM